MLTKLYPMVQFEKGTWEIDEFDCASIFLLEGTEKALLIDCGMGIGDLRGAVEMITDKPLTVVISHGHIDHTGNGRQFDELWIHPKDQAKPIPQDTARRRFDVERIARRQKSSIGGFYTLFPLYPFDLNEDLRDAEAYGNTPVIRDLYDGQEFDLGGGRIVTAYECPGHSPGEMVFLDSQTRCLFCGDALNYNLGLGAIPVETTLRYMKRLQDMSDRYDRIFNGHHDFRALGMPLGDDCLPNVITILEEVLAGVAAPCEMPSFWGQEVPLTREKKPVLTGDGVPINRVLYHRGRNIVGINMDNLWEKK